jgi:hypothetical protein
MRYDQVITKLLEHKKKRRAKLHIKAQAMIWELIKVVAIISHRFANTHITGYMRYMHACR